MEKDFDCGKATIKEIFTNFYSIPNYQRPYVWDSDQVEELLDCIEKACNKKEESYFLGSIVCKHAEKDKDFELLDGQQRITTIFLIFAALRDLLLENEDKFDNKARVEITACENKIYQQGNYIDDIQERHRIHFDIKENINDFIKTYVIEYHGTASADLKNLADKGENEDIRHMANTILVTRDFFQYKIENIPSFLQYLVLNVQLVNITTKNLQDAFQLFTVMNNTGLKLTNSDILKADNLRAVENLTQRDLLAREWNNMESYFGDDFDNFLSHIRTILVKKKAEYSLLKEFNDNIYQKKLLQRGEDTFSSLRKYFNAYQYLFSENDKFSLEISNRIKFMTAAFETDYWKAPILMFYEKFKDCCLATFLEKLDNKLSLDWIVNVTPSKRINNMNAILQCISNTENYADVLQDNCLEIKKEELDRFEQTIQDKIYGRKFAKYLLLKIDLLQVGNKENFILPQTISIEHILPQTPQENSQWKKDFKDEERAELTDKIGNLAVISKRKNSSQGNSTYQEKIQKYFKNDTGIFPSMSKVFQYNTEWKPENIRNRQKEIVDVLVEEYKKNYKNI